MVKVDFKDYSDYISYAQQCRCGNVYPLSIAEGYQQGEIFVNSLTDCKSVLFWHYSGFAFVSGEYDEVFLEEIYDIISDKNETNPRRFILFADKEQTVSFFRNRENIDIERRYFFEYNKDLTETIELPCDCDLKSIDAEIMSEMKGRITPYFSWNNADDFLAKGKGYCIITNGEISAWAFSASVSNNEIDIGVETQEKYQNRGYAAIVSKAMIKYILEHKKKPVWACNYKNIASARLAEKIGFDKISECFIIKRKHDRD
ncbi:MAG: GNAT family N-acetyltransferase [Oscillospiraceae bacterium]|nr:GNAT family N-acetyltransferase [Oscillospiraceae bacterium]